MGKYWNIYHPVVKKPELEQWIELRRNNDPRAATAEMLNQFGFRMQGFDPILVINTEASWLLGGKVVYFLEQGVTDFLAKSNYRYNANVFKGRHAFCVSWHPDDRFEGKQLPPVLVHVTPEVNRVTIQYNDGTGTFDIHMSLDDSFKPDPSWTPLNKHLHKCVFGILTYMAVFPAQIREGFPQTIADRCRRHTQGVTWVTKVVDLHPKIRATPEAHIRSGHFRALEHERFHRNPDGTIRIIYINPTIVGTLTPYTVEEADADVPTIP